MIIAVYAPHDPRDKRMLWDYLAHVINQWQGEVVIMGDFNENLKRMWDQLDAVIKQRYSTEVERKKMEVLAAHRTLIIFIHGFGSKGHRSKMDRFAKPVQRGVLMIDMIFPKTISEDQSQTSSEKLSK
ncbi:RNA-directed DNA polymerase, eukaryota [Tanacetum coccineum]